MASHKSQQANLTMSLHQDEDDTLVESNRPSTPFNQENRKAIRTLSMSTPDINRVRDSETTHPRSQSKFYSRFKTIDKHELIIKSYSCAFVGDILLQGRLYITANHFAFYSKLFGHVTRILMPCASVVEVTKEKTAKIIPNAVAVVLGTGERRVFGSLLSRDATYETMLCVWRAHSNPIACLTPDNVVSEAVGEPVVFVGTPPDQTESFSTHDQFVYNSLSESSDDADASSNNSGSASASSTPSPCHENISQLPGFACCQAVSCFWRAMGSGVGGCGTVMQHLLVLLNLVAFVGGVAVMAVGIWTLVDQNHFSAIVGHHLYSSAAIMLLVSGVIVAAISFAGCYGAVKAIRCLLIIYFVVVFVIFVLALAGGVVAYVFRDMVGAHLESRMTDTLARYDTDKVVKDTWTTAQRELRCCGVREPQDWDGKAAEFPTSCCTKDTVDSNQCSASTSYQTGCKDKVDQFVRSHALVIGGVGMAIACIMIVGMVCSLALYKMLD